MKKIILFLVFLMIPLFAYAEISSNLNVKTTPVKSNNRLVETRTYVDAEGNVTVPTDKGYRL